MAGDWIKMRISLRRDPRVATMADFLASSRPFINYLTDPVQRTCSSAYEHVTSDVTRAITIASLLEVWGVARDRGHRDGDDLLLKHCTLSALDDISGVPGFGEAMEYVEWAFECCCKDAKGRDVYKVRFPNFFKDQEAPEDRYKSQHAKAQAAYRERQKAAANELKSTSVNDITVTNHGDVTVTHREEKRREDKETNTFVDSDAVNQESAVVDQLDPEDKINRLPACPHQKILAIYSNELPALAQPRAWEGARAAALQARWKFVLTHKRPNGEPYATDLESGLDFFRRLFEYIRTKCPHLNGVNNREWQADLAWIVKAENFLKIIEGKYEVAA